MVFKHVAPRTCADKLLAHVTFNPIEDRGGDTLPPRPTNFFPVTSANVGISPQNLLNFSFNPFDRLV